MRKYQPIWRTLKLNGSATLSAPPAVHRRIVLAVRKEKTKDYVWKLECLDKGKKFKLMDKSNNSLLIFNLVPTEVMSYVKLTVNDF